MGENNKTLLLFLLCSTKSVFPIEAYESQRLAQTVLLNQICITILTNTRSHCFVICSSDVAEAY